MAGELSAGFNAGINLGNAFNSGRDRRRAIEASEAAAELEKQAAGELINVFTEESAFIKSRQAGLQSLTQLRDLASQPASLRKANAPVVFQQLEQQLGAPIADNIKDIFAKSPSEDAGPLISKMLSDFQNSEATMESIGQVFTNPSASAQQISEASKEIGVNQEKQSLNGPPPAQKTDPNAQKTKILTARKNKLLAIAAKYPGTKSSEMAFKQAQNVQKQLDGQLPLSSKGKEAFDRSRGFDIPEEGGNFGKGLIGLSESIMIRNQEILQKGGKLTPRQAMEGQFARANLTAPRDTIKVDPVTGQKEIVTITPTLPEGFGKGDVRVEVKDLEPELDPKKLRIQAAEDVKLFSSAKKKIESLVSFIQKNPSSVGVKGKIKKVGSAVSSFAGGPVDTSTNVLESKIESVRSDLRNLVDKGKFSDQDRNILNKIIGGTDLLDTPEGTLASFGEALKLIEGKTQSAKDVLKKGKPKIKFLGYEE